MTTATNRLLTRARKEHQCCLCLDPIPAGTEYVRERMTPWSPGDADAGFWTYRAHPHCHRILTWHMTNDLAVEWELPIPPDEWADMVMQYQARPQGDGQQGGATPPDTDTTPGS